MLYNCKSDEWSPSLSTRRSTRTTLHRVLMQFIYPCIHASVRPSIYPHHHLLFSFSLFCHPSTSFSHHSILTTPPNALIVSTIFPPSSFVTPSFITFGTLSTNFLLSISDKPNSPLTSLMILDFAAASKDSRRRVKRDFSCGGGVGSSSSAGAAGAAEADGPDAGAAKERSGMLRRD